MQDRDWQRLIRQLTDGHCTPFLGAGACDGVIDGAAKMSSRLAARYAYPFPGSEDLARVMQYAVVTADDPVSAKEDLIRNEFDGVALPDFSDMSEPHAALAGFPLRVYITTNFDSLMVEALTARGRNPRQVICPWYHGAAHASEDVVVQQGRDRPIVYHLHGHAGVPGSLVVTEDDYVEFLTALGAERAGGGAPQLLPPSIREYLTTKPLLFVGYSLRDWTFRVIFRWLVRNIPDTHQRRHISVQLRPVRGNAGRLQREQAEAYVKRYLDTLHISLYFGTARDFFTELHRRMETS
jgi:SIR2-like domain